MSKIDKEIANQLFSSKTDVVLDAISKIRTDGNALYINPLADLLISDCASEISIAVLDLFNDLKDNNCVSIIIDLILNDKYKRIKKQLISSCWQNSLNFNSYFINFVNIIVHDDFETGIEAFSVIDKMESNLNIEQLEKGKEIIKQFVANDHSDKQKLIHELYKLIDDIHNQLKIN